MRTKLFVAALILSGIGEYAIGQVSDFSMLNRLPDNVGHDKSQPLTYTMITDYYDYDLQANFIRKARISGDIAVYFSGDSVKWNNVYISEISDFNAPFPKGQNQSFFENFKYVHSGNLLREETFSHIPQIDFRLKNLVWDMFMFEIFAYTHWHELELNKEFYNKAFNTEVEMGKDGTFENKELIIQWIGVTKINDELCAIIQYSQMNGKLSLNLENIRMNGRSHYWGVIYVSLSDKQIEYANLTEDVITDVLIIGQPDNIVGYTVRKIELTRNDILSRND